MDFFAKRKDDIDDDPTDFGQPFFGPVRFTRLWVELTLSTRLVGRLCAFTASLRCPICKEFYRHPVITPCNHSFCSTVSTVSRCLP
jgi:hypothetical protein